jgi:hypothetical protein
MLEMWYGYFYVNYAGHYTVSWERPRLIAADASIFLFDGRGAQGPPAVTAWVRSVTVKDPASGAITVKESDATVPVRIEDNAIAVTFGLNYSGCSDAEALIHVYYWS